MKLFGIFILIPLIIIFSVISPNYALEFNIIYLPLTNLDEAFVDKLSTKMDSSFIDSNNQIILLSDLNCNFQKNNYIFVLNPLLLHQISESEKIYEQNRILSYNITSLNDSILNFMKTKYLQIDSLKIGFTGLITPDFPHLYPSLSKNLSFRFDIFDCAREAVAELKNNNVDLIIFVNYLGGFFDRKLIDNFPDIDCILEFFDNLPKSNQKQNYKFVDLSENRPKNIYLNIKRDSTGEYLIDSFSFYHENKF